MSACWRVWPGGWMSRRVRSYDPLRISGPDFDLIGLPHAADLPAVRRKLHNLAQRTDAKRAADRGLLEETLARIVGAR